MAPQYGEVRVDYITYTTGVSPNEANVTVPVSGLVNNPTFSGNVIIEGNTTIDGDLTVSGSINASGVVISGITGLFDDGTETAPSIAFASDPDTGIYKPATNTIGLSTNGDEKVRIDNSGRMLVGTSITPETGAANQSLLTIANNILPQNIAWLSLLNTAIIGDNFVLGGINFCGYQNKGYPGAYIKGQATGVWSATSYPTRLLFSTTDVNATTPVDRMVINNNGNVGIGTDDCLEKLHVDGTILTETVVFTTDQNQPYLIAGTTFYTGANTNWGTYGFQHRLKSNSGGKARVTIDTSQGEVFCVDSGQNVGIGTDSPEVKLDVRGVDQTSTALDPTKLTVRIGTNEGLVNSGGTLGFGAAANGRDAFAAINSLFQNGNNEGIGDLAFNLRAGVTDTTLAEVMRLKYNGNVGIGTDNPTALLTLAGQPNGQLTIIRGTATVAVDGSLEIGHFANGAFIGTKAGTNTSANSLRFGVSNLEKVRIDNGGRMLIGTSITPETGVTNQSLLTVSNNININNIAWLSLQNTSIIGNNFVLGGINFCGYQNKGYSGAYIKGQAAGVWSATSYPTRLLFSTADVNQTSPVDRMVIDNTGNVGIGTTLPNEKLDLRSTAEPTGFSETAIKLLRSNYGGKISGFIDQGVASGLVFYSITVPDGEVERMRILGNGNVGIGAKIPKQLLSVGADANADLGSFGISLGTTTATSARQAVFEKNTGPGELALTIRSSESSAITAPIVFQVDTNGEAMRINSDKKVGIGTAAPKVKLDVTDTTRLAILYVGVTQNAAGATKLALINNDGGGNCNITFNDANQTAMQNGSCARITADVDAAAGALVFSVGDNSVADTASTRTPIMALRTSKIDVFKDFNMAAGTGVKFNGSTSLDDYEEGTWTPTLAGSTTTGTVTYSRRTGTYTKIGRQVTIQCHVEWSSGTGGAGNLRITGLPFRALNGTNINNFVGAYAANISTMPANATCYVYLPNNSVYMQIDRYVTPGAGTSTPWAASGGFGVNLTYQTDD